MAALSYNYGMSYTSGSRDALSFFGLTKEAVYLHATPETSPGRRGDVYHDAALFLDKKMKGNPIGSLGYKVHPEGHAEVKSFFIDDDYQGKGHGQDALRQLMEKHKHLISDTTTGTTQDAQRAFKKLLAKTPDVEMREFQTKELDGKPYTDMFGDPTAIWYAKTKDHPGLSDQNLQDIVHNAMYHRRRLHRTYTGGTVGGVLGGGLGMYLGRRYLGDAALPAIMGAGLGAFGMGAGVNELQHLWDTKHNLHGDW